MPLRLGRHHPTIRRLRALRRDGARRRAESVLLAEGLHLAREALEAGAALELAVVSERLRESDEGRRLEDELASRGVEVAEVDAGLLDSLQDARSPQPILLLVRRPREQGDPLAGRAAPLAVVLVGVQDPGNLGSIVRTADAAGAAACFVGDGCADPYHPRAVRATMGSVFRLPLRVEPTRPCLERLARSGLRRIAAVPRAGDSYERVDLRGPAALILGGEGEGVPREILREADARIHVPMREGVESLSVGAAAAVLLFSAARQRGEVRQPSER